MTLDEKRAVVLLSGGVDSSTCLAVARSEGFVCYALTVNYGQRNSPELDAARAVATSLGVAGHRFATLDLSWVGGSALTAAIEVPKGESRVATSSVGTVGAVPVTYVPARNSLLLCLATAWAEVLDTAHLFIGVNQIDYSGYPDCRPAFVQAIQQALRLGTRRGDLTIHTPLIELSKAAIIQRGTALGLDYGLTWSCYDPQPPAPQERSSPRLTGSICRDAALACGHCDACVHRRKGFAEAGLPDPTPYA